MSEACGHENTHQAYILMPHTIHLPGMEVVPRRAAAVVEHVVKMRPEEALFNRSETG